MDDVVLPWYFSFMDMIRYLPANIARVPKLIRCSLSPVGSDGGCGMVTSKSCSWSMSWFVCFSAVKGGSLFLPVLWWVHLGSILLVAWGVLIWGSHILISRLRALISRPHNWFHDHVGNSKHTKSSNYPSLHQTNQRERRGVISFPFLYTFRTKYKCVKSCSKRPVHLLAPFCW